MIRSPYFAVAALCPITASTVPFIASPTGALIIHEISPRRQGLGKGLEQRQRRSYLPQGGFTLSIYARVRMQCDATSRLHLLAAGKVELLLALGCVELMQAHDLCLRCVALLVQCESTFGMGVSVCTWTGSTRPGSVHVSLLHRAA